WEGIQAARWDPNGSVLRVVEVGAWGRPRPVHEVMVTEPGRLVELIRERVTASILWQRYVVVDAGRGVRVIARRAPDGKASARWFIEYDDGLDPQDPAVQHVTEAVLAHARSDLGGS
ncbi:MAG: hypothetical protein ACRCYU_01685, partial [Nocardioides sp.]